jgi:hypothetical protein
MLRRIIIGGLAVALAAPIFATTPASAVILFTCSTGSGSASITPGISHNQTAQTDFSALASISGCSNSDSASVGLGSGAGVNTITSFPPRPLGCPVAAGGAGPDYANNVPILTGPDPSFTATWADTSTSTGIAKVKSAGPAAPLTDIKVVLVITAGKYLAPAGQKTKLKGTASWTPVDSGNCADDSDPFSSLTFTVPAGLIAQQV